jgi:hypothetical protein
MDPKQFSKAILRVTEDGLERLSKMAADICPEENWIWPYHLDDVSVYMWTQSWSDTGCGFGPGGQGFTSARTLIFWDDQWGAGGAVVYHDFRFAGHVKAPNDKFYEHIKNKRMIGAREDWKMYERNPERV